MAFAIRAKKVDAFLLRPLERTPIGNITRIVHSNLDVRCGGSLERAIFRLCAGGLVFSQIRKASPGFGCPIAVVGRALPLFHAGRHLRHRHQRLGHLIEQLAGVLLFAQRCGEELHDDRLAKLKRQVTRGRIGRNLIVLDPLRPADQGKVSWTVVLLLAFADDFLAFFD